MNIELVLLSILFLLSFSLLLTNFRLGISIMLVLSVFLHKELFSIYKWDVLPIRIFMLAFLCYSILLFFRENKTLKKKIDYFKDPFSILICLMWFISGISIFFSKNLYSSLSLFGFFTAVVGSILVLYNYLKNNPNEGLKVLKFYIGVVVALCLFCIFQAVYYFRTGNIIGALWNIPGNLPRLGATFWDVNHFGALIAVLIPSVGVFFLTSRGKERFKNLLILFLMTAILFMTNSRSAWIIAGIAFLSFASIYLYRKVGVKGLLGLVCAILIMVLGFYIEFSDKSSPFRKFVKDQFHYRIDSFDSHMMLLRGSYEIFEEYPYLGGGYGGFFEHFAQTKVAAEYFGRDPAALNTRVPAHTIWGETLSETGIFGFVTLILLVALLLSVPLNTALRSKENFKFLMSSAIFSSILGWFIAGIFYSYKSEFFWIMLTLYFSLSVGLSEKKNVIKEVLLDIVHSKFPLVAVSLLAFLLIFVGLGKNHLIPWDEAIYAKISKNILETGDPVTQYWSTLKKPWYEKPPLYMWMASASMYVFGVSEFSARLPSALLGFSTVVLVYTFARKLYGKTAGLISALSLVTTFHFLYYSRASMIDVSATFFIFLALYIYFINLGNKRYISWVLTGMSCGFAVMTKGVVGLLPIFFISGFEFVVSIVEKRFSVGNYLKRVFLMIGVALLVFMPWHVAMYAKYGEDFFDTYIGYHVFKRALTEIEDKGKPFLWYIEVMRTSMRIWYVVLIPALPFAAWVFLKKKSKSHLFLLSWVFYIFLFFSWPKSKLVWYIMPIYPATSIILGHFLSGFWSILEKKIPLFKNLIMKFLYVFAIFSFALFYLFLNRKLVFVSDLTGSQAKMMMRKDQDFGTDSTVYIDGIDAPLIYYYSDSPFKVLDYTPLKGVLKDAVGKKEVIFITKESRYRSYKEKYPQIELVAESKEWVLAYLPEISVN